MRFGLGVEALVARWRICLPIRARNKLTDRASHQVVVSGQRVQDSRILCALCTRLDVPAPIYTLYGSRAKPLPNGVVFDGHQPSAGCTGRGP